MADLSNLVHNLPQELFDEIFGLVFTPDATTPITINKTYLSPIQLQVSSATRRDFAKLYYGSSTGFSFTSTPKDNPILVTWLDSLPKSHLRMIKRLEILRSPIVGHGDFASRLFDLRAWLL